MPNCRVLKAHNGVAALAVTAETRSDLVLLDLMMPELDGFGVLHAMQDNERVRGVPVIVLTAQILTREDMGFNRAWPPCSVGNFYQAEVLAQVPATLADSKRLEQRRNGWCVSPWPISTNNKPSRFLARRPGAASAVNERYFDPLFSPGDRRHPHRLPAPLPHPPGACAAEARPPERHRRSHGHRLLRQQTSAASLPAGNRRDTARIGLVSGSGILLVYSNSGWPHFGIAQ